VGNHWNYICMVLDVHHRKIIRYSCGKNKNAKSVYEAVAKVKTNLKNICLFHTARRSEFKNDILDNLLTEF
jgi:putative transposase